MTYKRNLYDRALTFLEIIPRNCVRAVRASINTALVRNYVFGDFYTLGRSPALLLIRLIFGTVTIEHRRLFTF